LPQMTLADIFPLESSRVDCYELRRPSISWKERLKTFCKNHVSCSIQGLLTLPFLGKFNLVKWSFLVLDRKRL
jgi:hypothetical protein